MPVTDRVQPGYMGIATIDGTKFRCNSCGINPQQDILFYNHIYGLNDYVSTYGTKGEDPGVIQLQRKFLRPSNWLVSGGISFPVADDSAITEVFGRVKDGNYFNLDYQYYCDYSRTFIDCRVNTFNFNCQAGDVASASLDVMGMDIAEGGGGDVYQDAKKLITWDKIRVGVSGGLTIPHGISGIDFSANNNCSPIYTAGNPNGLKPYDLRLGTQEVTGTLSIYLESGEMYLAPTSIQPSTITIQVGNSLTITIYCIFKPGMPGGQVGPVVTELPFVGIDRAFGN